MPKKRKREVTSEADATVEVPTKKQKKWKNKERVLVFCSRGVTYRARHLMNDLRTLLPHSRKDTKLDRKDKLPVINEVCEMKNCRKCIFFEMKKKKDLYMWVSNIPSGPSVKFLVENVHTMDELKLTGNCLLGSRPLLSFDSSFDELPQHGLIKELFTQVFSTPVYHPKSKPFVDRISAFTLLDGRIWFRNYQVVDEGASLTEIGPRFVVQLIKVFQGSFGGATLYENPKFVTPNAHRRMMKAEAELKFKNRSNAKEIFQKRKKLETEEMREDPLETMFQTVK